MAGLGGGIARAERHRNGQYLFGPETGVDRGQLHHRPRQQSGAGEQHHRHRDLGDHQPALQSLLARSTGEPVRSGRDQRALGVPARERCREREQQGDRDREPEREPEHRAVELDLAGARRVAGDETDQQLEPAQGDEETQRGPNEREQEILHEQQPPQPAVAGAERGPHHQLVTPSHAPHQREICDVRRRDEENERRDTDQQPEGQLGSLADGLLEGNDRDPVVGPGIVGVGVLALEPVVDGGDLGPRLVERCARLQPPDELGHAMGAALDHRRAQVVLAEHHVEEAVHLIREVGRGLQHADHGHRLPVHEKPAADDAGVGTEAADPEVVGQDRHRRDAGAVVARAGESAKHRGEAHDVEEVAGDEADLDAEHVGVAAQHGVPGRVLRDIGERRRAVAQVAYLGDGEEHVLAAEPIGRLAEVHQAVAVAMGQRLEQHAADDAEDRGGGADAEREGDHDDGGEPGIPAEGAEAVAEVGEHVLDPGQAALLPHRLGGFHLEVGFQLRAEILVLAVPCEQPPEARKRKAHVAHGASSRGARNAAIRPAVRCHSRASCVSRFFPAAVSE